MKSLTAIMGNSQRLDGGAMFGNVPKALWSRWVSVDENNAIPLSCRALLVEDGDMRILFETGIGAFFPPHLKSRYGVVEEEHVLLNSLKHLGLTDSDIDVVVLSHLHFDHAGGLLSAWQEGRESHLLFPNAKYLVSEAAWERANNPCLRDRASFIPQLNDLLRESDRLVIINSQTSQFLGKEYHFAVTDGHTPGLMHSEITMPDGNVIFISDLIPATPWVHLPVSMGYDRFPEQLISEKQALLEDVVKNNKRLFYTHDPDVALSRVTLDENNRYQACDKLSHVVAMTC